MRPHRYAVGERVFYTEKRFPHLIFKEPYTIVRCLDSRHAEPRYRIRSAHRPCDCMAAENELSRGTVSMRASPAPEVSDYLNFGSMSEAANLNLVPWIHLPRRARHKNEQRL